MGKRLGLALVAVLLIPACATDKDALLNDQNIKAGEYIEGHAVQPDIKQAGKDVKLNSQTLAKNAIGEAPKELQKPYTPENSKTARDDSDKSHAGGFWAGLGGGLLTGALFIIGLARSPLARMIPGVGTILASLDSTMGALETWMKKMKEGGQHDVVAGLTGVLEEAHQVPAVRKFIDQRLGKIQTGAIVPAPEVQIATALAAEEAVATQNLATATAVIPSPAT